MKAFLLAAGYGTRLRPLTDKLPKCMVPIGGRPLKAALTLCAAALLTALLGYVYLDSMLERIHYSDGSVEPAADTRPQDAGESNDISPAPDSPDPDPAENPEPDDAAAKLEAKLRERSREPAYDENVLNILFVGCDSRSDTVEGRSDAMILVSINKNTEKIVLTSLLRDIYTQIPGYGPNRLNAAFAFGGASLLMDTLEENFGITVKKYVSINFYSFMDVVDTLGGVTIPVSEAERKVMNNYVRDMNKMEGLPADDGILDEAGDDVPLTGKQALGYCRIRYVGNADFERTQRQRTVLMQIYERAKSLNFMELNTLLGELLPNVTTNLDKSELYALLLDVPKLAQYGLSQDRIPIDGSYKGAMIRGMSVLEIDFEANTAEMLREIYGDIE